MPGARPRPAAACLAVLVAASCAGPTDLRREVIELDAQWRSGSMEEASFDRMVQAVRGLGHPGDPAGSPRAALPDLLRLSLTNPSAFVRAEALRAAWELGADLPPEPWNAPPLERADFNARTARLEQLIDDAGNPETVELARWLAQVRIPVETPEELRNAIGVAEVVLSQAAARRDAVGDAFRQGLDGSLHHALSAATLYAATDPWPVVREQALRSARHLHPLVTAELIEGTIERESDSTVMLAGLDSLAAVAAQLPAERLREVVGPLTASTDVAVRRQAARLLADLP